MCFHYLWIWNLAFTMSVNRITKLTKERNGLMKILHSRIGLYWSHWGGFAILIILNLWVLLKHASQLVGLVHTDHCYDDLYCCGGISEILLKLSMWLWKSWEEKSYIYFMFQLLMALIKPFQNLKHAHDHQDFMFADAVLR